MQNFIIPTEDGKLYLGTKNDDIFILSNFLIPSNSNITIQDNEGTNTIQFPENFEIKKSKIYPNALQLILPNNASIQILNSSYFLYDIGGDSLFGVVGIKLNYNNFVEKVLKLEFPENSNYIEGEETTIKIAFFTIKLKSLNLDKAVFDIVLDKPYNTFLNIDYNIENNTIIDGVHYGAISGTIVFEKDELSKSIELPLLKIENNNFKKIFENILGVSENKGNAILY